MRGPIIVLILALLYACEDTGFYDISGKVSYDNGRAASNAEIYLDGILKDKADHEGRFTISDVNAGNHTLKATSTDSIDGYSEIETDITLSGGDLDLESLLLPVPVRLLEPTEVTSSSINLIWNKCGADDFREYKIYIHHSSALDESTGTLLHIATDIYDTVLSVNEGDFWWAGSTLMPNSTYFFRVFVMNAFGRMSGSNILKVSTDLWDYPYEFTHNYTIELESAFAAQGNLTGIAWDGSYYWMIYYEELGGFYDNNQLTLVKYDHEQGATLDTIVFNESNYSSYGITWDGSSVWISFGACIRAVDLETEKLDRTYCAGEAIADLAWGNGNLLLLDNWNKVILLNPVNGSINGQFPTPFTEIGFSGERGIAYRDGEIWIINNWHNEICILDDSGKHIGVVEVDFLQDDIISGSYSMPMCFNGDRIVIAFNSQVRIYTIQPIE